MRRRALVLIFALGMSPAWAISSKEDCAKFAETFGRTLPNLTEFAEELSTLNYWQHIEGRGALKAAVDTSDAKREALLPHLRAYIAAMEDLTYQLQICARN